MLLGLLVRYVLFEFMHVDALATNFTGIVVHGSVFKRFEVFRLLSMLQLL